MNDFLNSRTNIVNLQFGTDKCKKMHVGKTQNKDICPDIYVDSWEEELGETVDGVKELKDKFCGKVLMEEVKEKKYLGDIISSDGKNETNITERTNRAIGIVNKIVTSLKERPYGRHQFKAYKIMREGLLIGGMLTNIESWINITKVNLEKLEHPDTALQKKLLSTEGNPCKAFMMLELGVIPVRFVVMQKECNLCTTYYKRAQNQC